MPIGLALIFAKAGTEMLAAGTESRSVARRLGTPVRLWQLIGLLELAGTAGLLVGLAWAPLGVAASAGLMALMVGALAAHARVRDPITAAAPGIVCLLGSAGAFALFIR